MFGRQDCVLLISVFDNASIVSASGFAPFCRTTRYHYKNELTGTLPREWSALESLEKM